MKTIERDIEKEANGLLQVAWGDKFPVDPIKIARQLGFEVKQAHLDISVAGAIFDDRPGYDPIILLNDVDSIHRTRFTAAHLIGQYVQAGHHIQRGQYHTSLAYVDYRSALIGSSEFADIFASALLMPQSEIKNLRQEDRDTNLEMVLHFGVPIEAVCFRLNNLGRAPRSLQTIK